MLGVHHIYCLLLFITIVCIENVCIGFKMLNQRQKGQKDFYVKLCKVVFRLCLNFS